LRGTRAPGRGYISILLYSLPGRLLKPPPPEKRAPAGEGYAVPWWDRNDAANAS